MYVLENMVEETRRRKLLATPAKAPADDREDCKWGLILVFRPGITFEGILARNLQATVCASAQL